MAIKEALIYFQELLGENYVLTDPDSLATYGRDWLKSFTPAPVCVLLPESTQAIQQILKFSNQHKIVVVPSGGRTGLSGGALAQNGEVVLACDRLNKVLNINILDRTITCQAGVITQTIQETALKYNMFFPIDFASKGSSQIGGNIATNAGGIRVLKYGNIRDWVLGLVVVLPNGELVRLNGALYKNNTGYDLKQLFIGAEGTLGLITEATLRLTTAPKNVVRVLCGIQSYSKALDLLNNIRQRDFEISMAEYFPLNGLEKVIHFNNQKYPLSMSCPHFVLMEFEECDKQNQELLEEELSQLLSNNVIMDASISQSHSQAEQLLSLRELLPETLNANYVVYKNDIAVPVPELEAFFTAYEKLIVQQYPEFEVVTFGHIADGNLHINILKPENLSIGEFNERTSIANTQIFELVKQHKGSISAEHGVGVLKKPYLGFSRSPTEIHIMRAIKNIFDPNKIMNTGKIFD